MNEDLTRIFNLSSLVFPLYAFYKSEERESGLELNGWEISLSLSLLLSFSLSISLSCYLSHRPKIYLLFLSKSKNISHFIFALGTFDWDGWKRFEGPMDDTRLLLLNGDIIYSQEKKFLICYFFLENNFAEEIPVIHKHEQHSFDYLTFSEVYKNVGNN